MHPDGTVRSSSSIIIRPTDNISRLVHTPIRQPKPRRTMRLTETTKLNKYLAELHAQEIKYKRELLESRKMSAKKRVPTASKNLNQNKIIQDIVVINTPQLRKQVSMSTPQPQPTRANVKNRNVAGTANPMIAFEAEEKRLENKRNRFPFDDKRYQNLVNSMSSAYLLSDLNENPNERLANIFNSNRALTKGSMAYERAGERVLRVKTFEENMKTFERCVSNLI
jgi:hypothetical protein